MSHTSSMLARQTSRLGGSSTSSIAGGLFALLACVGLAAAQTGTSTASPTPTSDKPAATAVAQPATPASTPVVRTSGIPQRDTLLKLMKPITVEFKEQRLEDVMRFITEVTGANIEPAWQDDRSTSGLNKESIVNINVNRVTALSLIEKVLEKLPADELGIGGGTWQMSSSGAIEVGPKERLNRIKRVEIYSIRDLLLELPDYINAPTFDLNTVLQQGGGEGGGQGQSPFTPNDTEIERRTLEERANELVDILTQLVESEQWTQNGGDGGTMRLWRDNLIVNAPDYIHRGLVGYSYWPSGTRVVNPSSQRRYVTLGVDTSLGTVDDVRNVPVTAAAGGATSGGGSVGPGGSSAPAAPAPK